MNSVMANYVFAHSCINANYKVSKGVLDYTIECFEINKVNPIHMKFSATELFIHQTVVPVSHWINKGKYRIKSPCISYLVIDTM